MSYGPNIPTLFRHAADYIDKSLPGTKPGELPVEQLTQLDPVINLKTAKALGLTVPHNLPVLAEEVVECKDASLWFDRLRRCRIDPRHARANAGKIAADRRTEFVRAD